MEGDVVRRDLEVASAPEPLDRALETAILERHESAAAVAQEVVVMPAAGVGWLVAGNPGAEVEAVDESELLELFQGPVDAGAANDVPPAAEFAFDLVGADCARSGPEALDHGPPRRSLLVASRRKPR
jgi:hypothetical protein